MTTFQLVFGSGESSLDVRRIEVREALSALFRASIQAVSHDASLDLSALVGQPAALGCESPVDHALRPKRLWTGVCAYAAQVRTVPAPGLSTYQIEIAPLLWLLTQRSSHRIFQHLSIPDIADVLLAEHAIAPVWEIDRGSYPKLEIKIQYGESDFAFFTRLLEEAGITFLFEDGEAETALVLRDAPQARPVRAASLPYFENANTAARREYVSEARVGREVRPGAFVLQDYDFRRPALPLGEQAPKAKAPEDVNEQVRYEPGAYLAEIGAGGDTPVADDKGVARYDIGYGKAKATRLLAGARAGKLGVTLLTNAIDPRPGTILTISDHAHPDVADRPLLTTHYTLEAETVEVFNVSVHAVSAELPYLPPAITRKPAVHGIQSATVVGPRSATSDDEIHVDEFGRVRVQFPWDRDGQADDFASCWMRVSQGWSGKAYGMISIPRVGQEVLVTFLDGDPDQPVVTGRLYNKVNPVPYALPDNKTISTSKTDSSPGSGGYNEIKFEDRKGQELFYHQAERDQRVLIKNDETITVLSNRRKDVAVMETDTTGLNRTEITGINRSEMTGVVRTTLIGGNRARLVHGNKGVMNMGNRQLLGMKTHDVIVKGDKRERSERDTHLYVKGDRRERVDADRSFATALDHHEKMDGSYALASGASSSYHASENAVGEGGESVSVKGPGGFLSIDASGVTISGTMVRINAGGSPGASRPAKPAKAVPARELKQPQDAKIALDLRSNEDVSPLLKHLAAVADQMKGKASTMGVVVKKWGKPVTVGNRNVFQRADLVDPNKKDKRGRTNLQRMKQGMAPVGPDGKSVNLHHMIQSDKGSIAEVAGGFHEKYHRIIHINPHTIPSGIDRKAFATWRRGYWKTRAEGLGGGGKKAGGA